MYFGLVHGNAVAFLEFADQVVAMAVELGYVAIGELAPFLPELAFQSHPLAFDDVFVHCVIPLLISAEPQLVITAKSMRE